MPENDPGRPNELEAFQAAVMGAIYQPDLFPEPRTGWRVGDHPFAEFIDLELTVPLSVGTFKQLPKEQSLDLAALNPETWVQVRTESGSLYTLRVVQLEPASQSLVVIGSFENKEDQTEYLAGVANLPIVGRPLEFSEFAHFDRAEQLTDVTYADREAARAKAMDAARKLVEEQGLAGMQRTQQLRRIQPHGTELKPLATSIIKAIGIARMTTNEKADTE